MADNTLKLPNGIETPIIRDSDGVEILFITEKQAFDSNSVLKLDWNAGLLYDTSAVQALDWNGRTLISANNTYVVNWDDLTLSDSDAAMQSLDWGNRTLFDSNQDASINYEARYLLDSTLGTVLDWDQSTLNTGSGPVLDWGAQKLLTSGSGECVVWGVEAEDSSFSLQLAGGATPNEILVTDTNNVIMSSGVSVSALVNSPQVLVSTIVPQTEEYFEDPVQLMTATVPQGTMHDGDMLLYYTGYTTDVTTLGTLNFIFGGVGLTFIYTNGGGSYDTFTEFRITRLSATTAEVLVAPRGANPPEDAFYTAIISVPGWDDTDMAVETSFTSDDMNAGDTATQLFQTLTRYPVGA